MALQELHIVSAASDRTDFPGMPSEGYMKKE